jgi:SAM-dependent methyltransferase
VAEFTGERVIPGQVNEDLWNEHLSRYAFASRYAAGQQVLDVGCGAGYGSAELARVAARVTGLDISGEAARYAREHYGLDTVQFVQGSGAALPFRPGVFGLVTAFEVIEHLGDWASLIREAGRVLTDNGLFLVSTPNKLYYAESRKTEGPNPFHEHEFEYEEFAAALSETFPHTHVALQNRAECLAFYPFKAYWPAEVRFDLVTGTPEEANFFLAICSRSPLAEPRTFAYVPRAANILREREQHIAKLEAELALKGEWLSEAHRVHRELQAHHEQQNRWAMKLEEDLHAAQARIVALHEQNAADHRAAAEVVKQYEVNITELEQDAAGKAQWALDTEKRLEAEHAQLVEVVAKLTAAEELVEQRSRWALTLQDRVAQIEAQLNLVRASRWIGIGRKLGVGPQL